MSGENYNNKTFKFIHTNTIYMYKKESKKETQHMDKLRKKTSNNKQEHTSVAHDLNKT